MLRTLFTFIVLLYCSVLVYSQGVTIHPDIIHFEVGGTERWVMEGKYLTPKNTGQSIFIGQGAGLVDDGGANRNVFVGDSSGYDNTQGAYNTIVGTRAFRTNLSGNANCAFGYLAMHKNFNGALNTATGPAALFANTDGISNTSTGAYSMYNNIYGNNNTASGYLALYNNTIAFDNTAVGSRALYDNTTGSQNTAIGNMADVLSANLTNATAIGNKAKVGCSDCLVLGGTGTETVNVGIGTSSPSYRLTIGGEGSDVGFFDGTTFYGYIRMFQNDLLFNAKQGNVTGVPPENILLQTSSSAIIDLTGDVGIGVQLPTAKLHVGDNVMIGDGTPADDYLLSVNGKIMAEEMRIENSNTWPDYVFESTYALTGLDDLSARILQLGHLPGIPSAQEIENDGLLVGDMQKKQMEKIEELTLYILQLHERISSLENQINK